MMYGEFVIFLLLCAYYSYIYLYGEEKKRPKKKFPSGPFGLPIVGYLPFLGKAPCATIAQLSKKWGSIFSLKLGRYTVVFMNDFNKIKELYKMEVVQGRVQLDMLEKRGPYGLVFLEGDEWKEVKRFLVKSLRDFGIGNKSMQNSILEEVAKVRQFLGENKKKPLYLKPKIEIAVVNALWELLTSEKYDITDPIKQKVAHVMAEGIANQNIVGVCTFLPSLAKMLPGLSDYAKAQEYFGAPENLIREIIKNHVEKYIEGDEKDFIDYALTKIFTTTDSKSMLYRQTGMRNLHYTIIDLFFAGSDTLSSTLSWAFLYLSMWPKVQEKVHEEIDRVMGQNKMPDLEDRSMMPYTEATMWEVLRKSSIVPLGLFHKSLSRFQFDGFDFPKGTIFLANLYHVHHDEEYWKDPETFRPERFINEFGQFRKDERVLPFFTGKRTCPGESLAMTEYFLFFTGICQQFQFSLDPNSPIPDIGPSSGFVIPPPKHQLLVHERFSC